MIVIECICSTGSSKQLTPRCEGKLFITTEKEEKWPPVINVKTQKEEFFYRNRNNCWMNKNSNVIPGPLSISIFSEVVGYLLASSRKVLDGKSSAIKRIMELQKKNKTSCKKSILLHQENFADVWFVAVWCILFRPIRWSDLKFYASQPRTPILPPYQGTQSFKKYGKKVGIFLRGLCP